MSDENNLKLVIEKENYDMASLNCEINKKKYDAATCKCSEFAI